MIFHDLIGWTGFRGTKILKQWYFLIIGGMTTAVQEILDGRHDPRLIWFISTIPSAGMLFTFIFLGRSLRVAFSPCLDS